MSVIVSEALYKEKLVVDNATDMICTLDADGTFTRVNPASMRLLGFDAAELTEKDFCIL